jgi:DNA polymerase III alpha subunit
VNQTPENASNSSPEVIRKVFVKDLKSGSSVNTVFKVADKARHTTKGGKVFLALTLFDKTGTIDGRIFENVDAAENAFQNDDFLLVSAKMVIFHRKPQLLVERLERLDPGPIDASEFASPPPPTHAEKPEKNERRAGREAKGHQNLWEDPAVAAGVQSLLKHIQKYIDERVEQRLAQLSKPERFERPHRAERAEYAAAEEHKVEKKPEPHKSGLPRDLAFKPFSALAPPSEAENTNSSSDAPAPS